MLSWIVCLAFLIIAAMNKESLDVNYYLIAAGLFSMSGSLCYIGSQVSKAKK